MTFKIPELDIRNHVVQNVRVSLLEALRAEAVDRVPSASSKRASAPGRARSSACKSWRSNYRGGLSRQSIDGVTKMGD